MVNGLGRNVHLAAAVGGGGGSVGDTVAVLRTTRLVVQHLLIQLLDGLGLGTSGATRPAFLALGLLLLVTLGGTLAGTGLASGAGLGGNDAVGERLGSFALESVGVDESFDLEEAAVNLSAGDVVYSLLSALLVLEGDSGGTTRLAVGSVGEFDPLDGASSSVDVGLINRIVSKSVAHRLYAFGIV